MSDLERLLVSVLFVISFASETVYWRKRSPARAPAAAAILPDSIAPGGDISLAATADGLVHCATACDAAVRIQALANAGCSVTVLLGFHPDRLVFSDGADYLAAADKGGNIAVVHVASGDVAFTHCLEDGVRCVSWSSETPAELIVLGSQQVFSCGARPTPGHGDLGGSSWDIRPVHELVGTSGPERSPPDAARDH